MIKRIGVYRLPQGADGDAFWKYHKEVHAVQAKEAFGPYLKRYVINRVRRVINGSGSWYGIVETWWESHEDIERGFANINFAPEARPLGEEGIAENAHQLFALCREQGVNHLIYAGFAINWCLLLSPGGMADMSKHGVMCSALRQAVTAVENKETARTELNKQIALWRVALAFGFVFDVDDFIGALGHR